jgi:hypothetical protein
MILSFLMPPDFTVSGFADLGHHTLRIRAEDLEDLKLLKPIRFSP